MQDLTVTSFIEGLVRSNARQLYSELRFDQPTEHEDVFMEVCARISTSRSRRRGGIRALPRKLVSKRGGGISKRGSASPSSSAARKGTLGSASPSSAAALWSSAAAAAVAAEEEEDRVGGETDGEAEADSWKPAVAIGGVASADTAPVPGLLQRKLTHKRAEVEGRQGQDQGDGYGDSGGGGAAQEEAGWQAEAGPFGKPARAADTGTSLTAHRRDIANAILAARQDAPPGTGRVCV